MDWTMLAGPIIGAIIGYFTNYIAVKMLFRPYEAKYLFGRQLPFTPGIIPKSRDRIANAISEAVSGNLLTADAIEHTVLAPEFEQKIADKVNQGLDLAAADERSVRDIITFYMNGEEFDELMDRGEAVVSELMTIKILEMDLGTLMEKQVIKAIHEHQESHFMSKLLTEEVIASIAKRISVVVDEGVAKEGPAMIQNVIHKEFEKLECQEIGDLVTVLQKMEIDWGAKVAGAYDVIMRKRLAQILQSVDISGIVRGKINGMDPKELERLTLTVAKKELGAIVNLGALIGFVLGCLNLIIDML
ncbi:MAG: DUF445 family protein [Eubacterium sp.]|nr:DUF445 family protein [Eubacterium sp.]